MYGEYELKEADWDGAQTAPVRVVQSLADLIDGDTSVWKRPFITTPNLLESNEFIQLPKGEDRMEYILDHCSDISIAVGHSSEKMTFGDWFRNHRFNPEMYLRDMHVNRIKPDFRLFKTPSIFPDWLNEYCVNHERCDRDAVLDFQFLYWGAQGSKTTFHRDVMGTFSWSHNIQGLKFWRFFTAEGIVLECTQGEGETVFVPSQCFHTVKNICDDTISVNQNWINEHNIHAVAEQLATDSGKVLADLLGYGATDSETLREEVEKIVWANNSLNLSGLLKVIEFALECRSYVVSSVEGLHNVLFALDIIGQHVGELDQIQRIRNRLA